MLKAVLMVELSLRLMRPAYSWRHWKASDRDICAAPQLALEGVKE